MIQDILHENLCQTAKTAHAWFESKRKDKNLPIYSSFDIRDSGQKIAVVDANIFPGGFNNVCRIDREECPKKFRDYVDRFYGTTVNRLALITEEHTSNAYYWDNVFALQEMLTAAGFELRICIPRDSEGETKITSASGHILVVESAVRDGAGVKVGRDYRPQLLVSNNDFSNAYSEWSKGLETPMTPPSELGWYQRKKSRFFKHYNSLAGEFADLLRVDSWHLKVETELFEHFDVNVIDDRESLALKVDGLLSRVQAEYSKRGKGQAPAVFVKNNAGTYGLAVTSVGSGGEIRNWNSKSRQRMSASKGGREVEELIIQEGIPTQVQRDGATAEPVIYMVGCNLAGGFLRAHDKKGAVENLNSPGSVFKSLCMSDLQVRCEKCPLENVYGWVARLGLLAIEAESREMGVVYRGALDPFR